MKKESSFGDVSKKAIEFGPDTVIPELVLNGNTFFIVKTGKKVEAFVRPLEKVSKDIRGAVLLRNELREVKRIVEEYKESEGFSINRSVI